MSLLDNKAPSDKDNFDNDEVFIKNYRDSIFDWRFYKDVLMFALLA